MTDAYIEGFCKTAEEYGVDQKALMKIAAAALAFGPGNSNTGISAANRRLDYVFSREDGSQYGAPVKGVPVHYKPLENAGLNAGTIATIKTKDGNVYRVLRSIDSGIVDGRGRPIVLNFGLTTKSPWEAAHLARGRLSGGLINRLRDGVQADSADPQWLQKLMADQTSGSPVLQARGYDRTSKTPQGIKLYNNGRRTYSSATGVNKGWVPGSIPGETSGGSTRRAKNVLKVMQRVIGKMSKRNKLLAGAGVLGVPSGVYGLYNGIKALRDKK